MKVIVYLLGILLFALFIGQNSTEIWIFSIMLIAILIINIIYDKKYGSNSEFEF